ncbi:MAG: galactose oxidase-like domain-containing protein [Phycisphaerae bacterium]
MSRRSLIALGFAFACVPGPFVAAQCPDPAGQGCWAPEINSGTSPTWPSVWAVHSALLKNGKVLCIAPPSEDDPEDINVSIFDPITGTSDTSANLQQQNQPGFANPPLDLFCSGHAQLADGRVVFVGGGTLPGTAYTVVFDPDALPGNPWTKRDNIGLRTVPPTMNAHPRWYPTCTTLANGRILVTAGRDTISDPCDADPPYEPGNIPLILDVNQPSGQQWTWLDESARLDLMWYPFVFQTVAAGVFMGGSNYFDYMFCVHPNTSRYLNPALSTWSAGPNYNYDCGTAVMYDVDSVLMAGGRKEYETGEPADHVYLTTTKGEAGVWTVGPSLNVGRFESSALVLADGSVLIIGGGHSPGGTSRLATDAERIPYRRPEWRRYSMQSGWATDWQLLAPMSEVRMYHSSTLLLPDGRVYIAGGQWGTLPGATLQETAQIFSPPYLFAADGSPASRPQVYGAPTHMYYDTAATVWMTSEADAAGIVDAKLIRLGCSTHAFDQNTRGVTLKFTVSGPLVKVAGPANAHAAPPGYYMLFLLKAGDRPYVNFPSNGMIVKLQ